MHILKRIDLKGIDLRQRYRRWIALGILVLVVGAIAGRLLLFRGDSALARIQQSGVWRVGMDPSFPPFENVDGTGQMQGLDVDLARAIAAHWGVKVELVSMGFDQLLDAVAAKRIDSAISGMTVVDYRTKDVSFSSPYIEAGLVLAVPHGSAVHGTADLAGRRVAVEWGSEGDGEARTLQKLLADAPPQLVLRESSDEALAAVAAGDADAAIVDAITLALYRNADLVAVGAPLQSDPYVVVVPARSPQLLQAVNDALSALAADGTLATLKARWLEGK